MAFVTAMAAARMELENVSASCEGLGTGKQLTRGSLTRR